MSTIATNTITNVAGNATGVGIAVSNAATYNSEGGAVTQNLVQGLAKAWARFNGQNTPSLTDSYNVSSLTDSATGQYYVNLTSAMTDGNYSFSSLGGGNSDSNNTFTTQYYFNGATSASATAFPLCSKFNGSVYDNSNISVLIHGDLA